MRLKSGTHLLISWWDGAARWQGPKVVHLFLVHVEATTACRRTERGEDAASSLESGSAEADDQPTRAEAGGLPRPRQRRPLGHRSPGCLACTRPGQSSSGRLIHDVSAAGDSLCPRACLYRALSSEPRRIHGVGRHPYTATSRHGFPDCTCGYHDAGRSSCLHTRGQPPDESRRDAYDRSHEHPRAGALGHTRARPSGDHIRNRDSDCRLLTHTGGRRPPSRGSRPGRAFRHPALRPT